MKKRNEKLNIPIVIILAIGLIVLSVTIVRAYADSNDCIDPKKREQAISALNELNAWAHRYNIAFINDESGRIKFLLDSSWRIEMQRLYEFNTNKDFSNVYATCNSSETISPDEEKK